MAHRHSHSDFHGGAPWLALVFAVLLGAVAAFGLMSLSRQNNESALGDPAFTLTPPNVHLPPLPMPHPTPIAPT